MRSTSADFQPANAREDAALERRAAYAPFAIVLYFAVQLAVRLWLSPNLEVDDAEMVGQIHWAWGYANSHPPLYHWVVRLAHDLFGNWVAATSVPKYALLAAGYLLIYDAGRRASGARLGGALAAATLLFIPVLAWKTQGKLTHSVLGCTATAATVHAAVLIVTHGRWWTFLWLGAAAAIGLLAKYNYVLVLVALALAVLSRSEARRAFTRPALLISAAVTFVLIAPHLLWIRANPALATERVYMLQTGGGPLGLNLPANSVADGLFSLLLVVLVSIVPAAGVWGIAVALRRDSSAAPHSQSARLRKFAGALVLAELAVFAATIVIGGFTQVHERYLVVLLPPVGLWFALGLSRRSAAVVLGSALVVAVAVTIARPLSVLRGTGRLMFPYDEMAAEAARLTAPPFAVLGDRPENAANIVIRLPSATVFDARAPSDRVIVAADTAARAAEVAMQLGSAYRPHGEPRIFRHRFPSQPERQAQLVMQPWSRASKDAP